MKSLFKVLLLTVIAAVAITSCSEDEFTETIFDTAEKPLDKTAYTFPLDSFVKREFLEQYNMKFIYKMEEIGSDMNYNLTPAPYENSVQLAALAKYLWYDCYKELAGEHEVFLKKYSPRIIHVIGSKQYNPSQGTEVLGVAEGGIKITLTNVNNLNVNNIEMMNEYFFKTMHHEFAHILDQTVLRPTAFNLVSNGHYDSMGWSDTPDSVSIGNGFVSPYASSAVGEDWVENIAMYITTDSVLWNQMLHTAEYEWEMVDCEDQDEYDKKCSYGCNLDTIGYYKPSLSGSDNKIYRRKVRRDENDHVVLSSELKTLYSGKVTFRDPSSTENPKDAVEEWKVPGIDWSTVKPGAVLKISAAPLIGSGATNKPSFNLVDGDNNNVATTFNWDTSVFTMNMDITITQAMLDKINATADKSLTISGQAFIINKVELEMLSQPEWLHETGIIGRDVIMKKIEFCRNYLKENYDIDLDAMRNMVQERTYVKNPDGSWALDSRGRMVNKLTSITSTGKRLIDDLVDEIMKLKPVE